MPPPATNLLRVARLKLLARAIGIRRLDLGREGGYALFEESNRVGVASLAEEDRCLVQAQELERRLRPRVDSTKIGEVRVRVLVTLRGHERPEPPKRSRSDASVHAAQERLHAPEHDERDEPRLTHGQLARGDEDHPRARRERAVARELKLPPDRHPHILRRRERYFPCRSNCSR